jgi:CubicO group peptidase (beta-lactamase class C family)
MKTLLILFLTAAAALADLPVSGRPVPALSTFDTIMHDEMAGSDATAGVLGISRNGRVLYLRAFGYLDDGTTPLPETALMRIASCSKPFTAAAARQLADAGAFGALGLQRRVFNLTVNGVNNNGLLNVEPFLIPGVNLLGDDRYADITVGHLIDHSGGFNRAEGPRDPTFRSREIAEQMGVSSPPSRHNVMRWMLGRPLFWAPGTVNNRDNEDAYSNFGYMVLGEIVNTFSPQGSYHDHLHNQTLTSGMWVPSGEFLQGRSLITNRHPREPLYVHGQVVTSAFDEFPFPVPEQYGGWSLEGLRGAGGLIASAQAMLEFGARYNVWYPNIGRLQTAASPTGSFHSGALDGTSTALCPRGDANDMVVYAAFNVRNDDNGDHLAGEVVSRINTVLNNTSFTWPATTSDGFWVSAGSGTSGTVGRGGYNDPYRGFAKAWNETTTGSRIRMKPGNNQWSGTLNRKMRLDAPEGTARIGVQ